MGQRAERRLVVDGDRAGQALGERVARAEAVEAGEVGGAQHDRRVGACRSAGRVVGRSGARGPACRVVGPTGARGPAGGPIGARRSAGRVVGPIRGSARGAGRRAQQRGQGEADAEHAGATSACTSADERGGAVEHGGRGEGPVVAGVPSVRAHHAVQPDRAHGQRVDVDGHPERDGPVGGEPHGPRRPPDPPRGGRVLDEHARAEQRLEQGGHRGPGQPGARGELGPRRACPRPAARPAPARGCAVARWAAPRAAGSPWRRSGAPPRAGAAARTRNHAAPAASGSKSSNAERSAIRSV